MQGYKGERGEKLKNERRSGNRRCCSKKGTLMKTRLQLRFWSLIQPNLANIGGKKWTKGTCSEHLLPVGLVVRCFLEANLVSPSLPGRTGGKTSLTARD